MKKNVIVLYYNVYGEILKFGAKINTKKNIKLV